MFGGTYFLESPVICNQTWFRIFRRKEEVYLTEENKYWLENGGEVKTKIRDPARELQVDLVQIIKNH